MIRSLRPLLVLAVATLPHAVPAADAEFRFQDVRRVVAFADVHGAHAELVTLLREAGVVDETLRWRAGDTHLVSLGDLLDRGPDSRKVMDLLMRLEAEARDAGGQVHVLLGNHEIMNLVGDLRYVSVAEFASFAGDEDSSLREAAWTRIVTADPAASRADFDAKFPAGFFAHRKEYSATGRYGRWLLTKPFLITINGVAFVHAGLPGMVVQHGLEGTNQALHAQLAEYLRSWEAIVAEVGLARPVGFLERPDVVAAAGAQAHSQTLAALQSKELFTPTGPTWYRGQALCYPYAESDNLQDALAAIGASRVVEGHTVSPHGRVQSRFEGRVVLLDAGMLTLVYRGSAAALIFENGAWTVAYADRPGERLQPEPQPRAVGPRPAGMDDDALERWLESAEVVGVEELDAGITEPQRVTLRKDGVELRAVFKQLSTSLESGGRPRTAFESDRFEYEIAAYRLDRLLGLEMVPVTVQRAIGRRRGILQFWIDDSINLRHMIERKLVPQGWCGAEAQYNLMNVFDVLTHNMDRTQENALFTRDWMLVLIDHSRAFATHSKSPVLLYKGEVQLPRALAERLRALDRETLQRELGPWLHRRQIDAIVRRRDQLLSRHDGGIAGLKRAAP